MSEVIPFKQRAETECEERNKVTSMLADMFEKVRGDEDYAAYIGFCVLGSEIKAQDPERFEEYVEEIRSVPS